MRPRVSTPSLHFASTPLASMPRPSACAWRSMATRSGAKRAATASHAKPRRNAKRVHDAIAQTSIRSVALSLASSRSLRVLGLDINTNSTGYAVLGGDGRVVSWGQVSTTQFPSSDILAIAHAISSDMATVQRSAMDNHPGHDPVEWHVGIEDFMRMYRFGSFHNKGIFQLAQLNGIVSYACWQRFGCRPVHTHPTAARALFGIIAATKSKKTEATVKEQVMDFVLSKESNSDALQLLQTHHVNRFGQWTEAAYDIADAYIVAAYTRWMVIQRLLQSDIDLITQFSDAYLALAVPSFADVTSAKKKKTTAEETALLSMGVAAKRAYLTELFEGGVVDWVKANCSIEQQDN